MLAASGRIYVDCYLLLILIKLQSSCCLFGSIVEFATYGDMKNVITKLDDTEINGRRIRIVEQKSRGRRQRYADCIQWPLT